MRMDLLCLCFLFLAGSLGEISALEAMLSNPDDIKVNVHQWRWSSHQPWPPLKSVLGTQFWSGAQNKKIRDHLLRPAQTVQLTTGGQFVTVDTRGSEPAPGEVQDVEEPPLLDPETAVCFLSSAGHWQLEWLVWSSPALVLTAVHSPTGADSV